MWVRTDKVVCSGAVNRRLKDRNISRILWYTVNIVILVHCATSLCSFTSVQRNTKTEFNINRTSRKEQKIIFLYSVPLGRTLITL